MRNSKIDLLRFIGLMMIILAHMSPSNFVNQLRNFDVPMMVFISGISFKLSFKGKLDYGKYIWKRVKRLVFPVWIFLTLLFSVAQYLFPEEITTDKVITSYLFLEGIGYVWIIRVFLLMAIIAPVLLRISDRIRSNRNFLIILFISFLIYDLTQNIVHDYYDQTFSLELFDAIVFYVIPYSVIYLLGIRAMSLSKKDLFGIVFFCSTIFIGMGIFLYWKEGKLIYTQGYKYPISTYYAAYALMASLSFWIFGDIIWEYLVAPIKQYVLFVSQNSIWMYLWHIPFIRISEKLDYSILIEYPIIVFVASFITYVQITAVEKLIVTKVSNEKMVKNIRLILKG